MAADGQQAEDRLQRLRPTRATTAVAAVVALNLAAGLLCLELLPSLPAAGPVDLHIPWPILTLLFIGAQIAVLNIQIRREARSVFLSEIPLALALAFSTPSGLLLARILGAVAFAAVRRQHRQPAKLLFNLSLAFAEAGIALAVFHATLHGGDPTAPAGWVAIEAANVAASCFAGVSVALVIQLVEDDFQPIELGRLLLSSAPQAAVVAMLGCIAVIALDANPWAAVLLVAVGGALFAGYGAYSNLRERHLHLERIYRFTQIVANNPEMSGVLTGVLEQARDLLQAEQATVTFVGSSDAGPVEVGLAVGASLRRGPARVLDEPANPLVKAAFEGTSAVLLPRSSRDAGTRDWLRQHDLRELLAVPLRGDAGVIAVLAVSNRLGEARGFNRDDVHLLETVANHAAIALRNGKLVDQLRHESLHDSLTHLPNRTYLHRELEALLADERRGQVVVGILDLDNFKEVNDTLGHAKGDDLLREVAARLTSAAGDRAVIARLGGDEFAAVFAAADADSARLFGRTLVRTLHEPIAIGDIEVDVGGSLGLALTANSGFDRATLMKHADIAMYDAKQSGYDVRIYDPAIDRTAPSRLSMIGRLRTAINSNTLDVYLQPKASLVSGDVIGAEALVRWSDGERGPISADEFIPMAERSGLIRPLTDIVLRQAIEACASWQDTCPGIGVAVNLSVRALTDDSVVDQVLRALNRYDVPADLLTLEITESSVMSDPARSLDILSQLRAIGVWLSVDDFGTGYSSLSHLRRLPVSELKIDRSFVAEVSTDPENAAVARAIIDLGRSLGLQVVAEGIETPEARNVLRRLGCDIGQGYLFGRPMPIEHFRHWLRQHNESRLMPVTISLGN